MKNISYILVVLLVIFSGFVGFSEPVNLAMGDSAYSSGHYDEAIDIYQHIDSVEGHSAALLFNMGNTYYKAGDEGRAMVSYLRAKRLEPDNNKINENIRFLSSKVEDANKAELKGKKGNVSPDPLSFFQRVGSSISEDTASDYWATFAAIAFVLLLGAIAVYIFSPAVSLKKIGFFSAIIMLFFSVVFTIFAFSSARAFENKDTAVLTTFKYTLLEEPSDGARSVGTPLHKGTVFHILEKENDADGNPIWYKVRLNSVNIGWVAARDVEVI